MKAEERKALESNSLQEGLTQVLDGVKQGPSNTLLFWVGSVVLAVLAVMLFFWFARSSEATASGRWVALGDATFLPQVDELVGQADLKDTPQGRLARFKSARLNLSQGLRELGGAKSDRARESIAAATKDYDELLRTAGRVPLLHQEALWGAAKGHEAQGEYEKARELYGRLVKEYAASALGKDAEKQLKRLDDNDEQKKKDLADLARAFGAKSEGRPN